MNEETQQMFVELNKQIADLAELVRQANRTSEEALDSVRELVDKFNPIV